VRVFCPKCHDDYPETWKVCPKDATELLKSSRIGKYTIESPIGVGGMGTVYRAINPDTRGEVAIKVMHADVADSESARSRFKREAAAVAKLKTSHVVKVYDFGAEQDGTLYLVMELLDGHTLRDEIHPPPDTMDVARVQFVMDGVLKGLAAAHKSGIVHRDLKPENIFLANTDDGEVPRILDFGIARIESPDGATRSGAITRPGTVMGTAVYMAPEQLQGLVSQVGTWSDVYAIGAMLYELLAGTTPVKSGSLAEVLIQVRRKDVKPLAKHRPDLPSTVCDVVQRCLDPIAKNRPQNADELRTALAAVWGSPSVVSIPPSRPRSQPAVSATIANEPAPTEGPDTLPAAPHALGIATTMQADAPLLETPVPLRRSSAALTPTPTEPAPVPSRRRRSVTPLWLAVVIAVVAAVAVTLAMR
jgi:serine/threonine-protein kinase